MSLPRSVVEWLIYGKPGARRFTQDSPILPDVWIRFAEKPAEPLELILTPFRDATAGAVAVALRRQLGEQFGKEVAVRARIGYIQSNVAAQLSFSETVRVVLPMTSWWMQRVLKGWSTYLAEWEGGTLSQHLSERLAEFERGPQDEKRIFPLQEPTLAREQAISGRLSKEFLWMLRIVGWIAWARTHRSPPLSANAGETVETWCREHGPSPQAAVAATLALLAEGIPKPVGDKATIFQVNRNRPAYFAVRDSRLAVKADAAQKLFDVHCDQLAWVVVDGGIDATHPAFRLCDPDTGRRYPEPFERTKAGVANRTRVLETYDFSIVRDLVNPSRLTPAALPPHLRQRLGEGSAAGVRPLDALKDLKKRLQLGQDVDWGLLAPLLKVPHEPESYWFFPQDHGTHVAGILAADWRKREDGAADLVGLAPDLRLYDFRVLPHGEGSPDDEFNVIAALQFVRYLNGQKSYAVIHGANLSLSIPHEVANYACGRTPVCDECERLVASGVVVVAAAGNLGYQRFQTADGELAGYHTISITDPGNAEGVITVGATHRNRPHTYGVSYFSSRGPTGDGRAKPDLVAPGEKITAPGLDGEEREKDGTSMAAPHVSAAAAMLMARHNELVGEPARIKQILTNTATDLGRERYFQGAGVLDILRALQSI